MKATVLLFIRISFFTLSGCSAHEVKTETTHDIHQNRQLSIQNPPMTILRGERKLNLIKIMDGGICKNELEGAEGAFLIYADLSDVSRIKHEQGAAIFSSLENQIQQLSGDVLQEAIDKTNLSEDPFALDEDDAQQKLATQLTKNFRNAATDDLVRFKKETTLTIDVTAYSPSLIFYQKGCEATLDQIEETAPYGQLVSY
jgi:hypothetical protein